jgi:hypothetical protein
MGMDTLLFNNIKRLKSALDPLKRIFEKTNFLWITPLVGMVLFIFAMTAFLLILHIRDERQVRETMIRDVELSRQTMRGRLQSSQDKILRSQGIWPEKQLMISALFVWPVSS